MTLTAGVTSTEIDIHRFSQLIQHPNDLLLLDVRNDQEYEAWRIEARQTPETLHIPYVIFVEEEQQTAQRVPRDRQVIVVCAKGGASDYVAEILRGQGVSAANLSGGMIAWGNHYVTRPVVQTSGFQIYQIDRVARGCLSYLLVSGGRAALIDPLRHTQIYLDLCAEKGAGLALILDTHAHADHISGGPELARQTGAPYYLHPYDGIHPFDMLPARLPYEMLRDGMQLRLGNLTIQAIHVPGHTLGLVNFLVNAPDGSSYFFTGDSLFIKSFGRPDLGGQGQAWAPLVYESIFSRIKSSVPAQAWVLPGHYARHEEAGPDGLFMLRLGELWQANTDLQHTGRESFVQYVLAHLPNMPPQYIQIKRVNAGLAQPDEQEASELELGKNVCALTTAY